MLTIVFQRQTSRLFREKKTTIDLRRGSCPLCDKNEVDNRERYVNIGVWYTHLMRGMKYFNRRKDRVVDLLFAHDPELQHTLCRRLSANYLCFDQRIP